MMNSIDKIFLPFLLFTTSSVVNIQAEDGHSSCPSSRPYTVSPLKVGVEISGLTLPDDLDKGCGLVDMLKEDLMKYQLLKFKGQNIKAPDHERIARMFGGPLDDKHTLHPQSPNKHIARISNDLAEGWKHYGVDDWHIDGGYYLNPHKFVFYHAVSAATTGSTAFVNLYELVDSLDPEERDRLERTYIKYADRHINPVIFFHPVTGKKTMCLHQLYVSEAALDYGQPNATMLNEKEVKQRLQMLVERDNKSHIMYIEWEDGDFVISDNLSLAHQAEPESQLPPEEIGVRILHRISIIGDINIRDYAVRPFK